MQLIKLDEIKITSKLQMRVGSNAETVSEYAEEMLKGTKLPPITLYRILKINSQQIVGELVLAGGWHRYSAAKEAGIDSLEAEIHEGTMHDAILFAVSDNATHGLRRTKADKEKCVLAILEDDDKLSNYEVAKLTGTNENFVRRVRPVGLTPAVKVIERGGKKFEQKAANIKSSGVIDFSSSITAPICATGADRNVKPSLPAVNKTQNVVSADLLRIEKVCGKAVREEIETNELKVTPYSFHSFGGKKFEQKAANIESSGVIDEEKYITAPICATGADRNVKPSLPAVNKTQNVVSADLLRIEKVCGKHIRESIEENLVQVTPKECGVWAACDDEKMKEIGRLVVVQRFTVARSIKLIDKFIDGDSRIHDLILLCISHNDKFSMTINGFEITVVKK